MNKQWRGQLPDNQTRRLIFQIVLSQQASDKVTAAATRDRTARAALNFGERASEFADKRRGGV